MEILFALVKQINNNCPSRCWFVQHVFGVLSLDCRTVGRRFFLPPLHSPEDGALVLVFHFVVALVVLDALGQTKVADLHRLLVFHQHIPGSQVAVDVIFRSQIFHPLNRQRD